MTLLINQLDEHNESGIIYLIKNKVEEVLFLYDTEQEDLMKSIKEYYSSNFSNIKLYEERITEGNIDEFKEKVSCAYEDVTKIKPSFYTSNIGEGTHVIN